jgi:multicomponent Na+:H+ antiporter subunit G
MTDWIIAILIIAGSLFMLVAALGIVKLQDVYMRMHAITKASSLSIVLFLLAVIVHIPTLSVILGSVAVMVFIISTAPIASHMIARVSQIIGIPMAKGAVMNAIEEDNLYEPTFESDDENTLKQDPPEKFTS